MELIPTYSITEEQLEELIEKIGIKIYTILILE